MPTTSRFGRRRFLRALGATTASGAAFGLQRQPLRAQTGPEGAPYFLIVLGASGGANLLDSLLARRRSECPATVHSFPDQLVSDVPGTDFRAVNQSFATLGPIPMAFETDQLGFVDKRKSDLLVVTHTGTSVNHAIAQRRAVTGNEAWLGRTLQETVAATYGEGFVLPNVHLTETQFAARGLDDTLPSHAFGETVADPLVWPLALDGRRGILGAPSAEDLQKARALRNDVLDPNSQFSRIFGQADRLKRWRHQRGAPQAAVESQKLIDKLILLNQPDLLADYGLQPSPDLQQVREVFPDIEQDPFEAQAALAFLLLKNQVSCTVTLAPSLQATISDGQGVDVRNPPIAFDFSHQDHPSAQAFMWQRIMRVADGLADLLATVPFGQGTMWDRTLIYIASDFGRTRTKPSGVSSFGSGHELNNGSVILSPLVDGGRVLGGVDPSTGYTFGFDRQSGAPAPGTEMTEPDLFAGILQALEVDTADSGLPDVPAMRKG